MKGFNFRKVLHRTFWSTFLDPFSDWRSWTLSWWWMSFIILLEVGFIVAIAKLAQVSQQHDGFPLTKYSPVLSFTDASFTEFWHSQFRWTLVPGIIMSLFALGYSATVAATAERQPYVELNHVQAEARSVNHTVLLDYPAKALLCAWAVAWHNRDFVLGLALLFQLIASVMIVPLASNLFRARNTQYASTIELQAHKVFDAELLKAADLQPATELARAVHIYGAAPTSWMTIDYAIEKFVPIDGILPGHVSVQTNVYYAKLDCQSIPRERLRTDFDPTTVSGAGSVLIEFEDRDCNVTGQGFNVFSDFSEYAYTWYQLCSLDLYDTEHRIGVFLGTYSKHDSQKLGELITVSCIPTFHSATAIVDLTFPTADRAQVSNVEVLDREQLHSLSFSNMDSNLRGYTLFAVSSKADAFGQAVLSYVKELTGSSKLEANAALNATKSVYRTLFAALAITELMAVRDTPKTLFGTRLLNRTRLYVVAPVAYAFIALLAVMLFCSIGLLFRSCRTTSILREEPVGLLGKANLVYKSDIVSRIEDFYSPPGQNEELVQMVARDQSVKTAQCWYEKDPNTNMYRIRLDGLGWSTPKLSIAQHINLKLSKIWNNLVMGAKRPFSNAHQAWRRWRTRPAPSSSRPWWHFW